MPLVRAPGLACPLVLMLVTATATPSARAQACVVAIPVDVTIVRVGATAVGRDVPLVAVTAPRAGLAHVEVVAPTTMDGAAPSPTFHGFTPRFPMRLTATTAELAGNSERVVDGDVLGPRPRRRCAAALRGARGGARGVPG